MVPVFLCTFAGRKIDSYFGTKWTLLLMILGFLAGISCAWRLASSVNRMEEQEKKAERMEQLQQWQREHPDGASARKPKRASRINKEEEKSYGESDKDPGC